MARPRSCYLLHHDLILRQLLWIFRGALQLQSFLETEGAIPFTILDIKKLKGDWDSYFRLGVGQIRVIFTIIDRKVEILLIYDIDFGCGSFETKERFFLHTGSFEATFFQRD